jgi:hypothetical protein
VDGVADHLGAVAPGGLGAIVLSGVVDGMAGGERTELLDLIDAGLGRPGVLVIHSVTAREWDGDGAPPQADLSPGRPLRGESWCHLLRRRGYDASVRSGPDGADYLVVAGRDGPVAGAGAGEPGPAASPA